MNKHKARKNEDYRSKAVNIWAKIRKFLGEKTEKVSGLAILGVVGVMLMYVGVAGIVSISSPWWLGKGDAPRHIDYAWSVYNKKLPKYTDGLQQKNFQELRKNLYRYQPASSNPPLFYAVHAVFVGPSLKSGQWQKAIAIGRAVNISIGLLCIIALAWAGWLFGSNRKNTFMVAVPGIGVMMHQFTVLNLNYAVDVLLVLIGTLSIITMHKIINNGIKPAYIFWLTMLSIAGMATKVTYITFVGVALLSIMIVPKFNQKSFDLKKLGLSIGLCFLLVASVCIGIGWFYYFHNYRVTGSFTTAIPSSFPSTRPDRTFFETITSTELWGLLYASYTSITAISVALFSFAVAGILTFFDRASIKTILKNQKNLKMLFLLLMTFIGMFLIQIVFATDGGKFFFRYMLPVLLPISLLISFGLLQFRWVKGQVVAFFAVVMGMSTIYKASRLDMNESLLPSFTEISKSLKDLPEMVLANGLSRNALIALLIAFSMGSILISLSMLKVSDIERVN